MSTEVAELLRFQVNPFASCRTRAGVLPFRFPEGESLENCRRRLHLAGWHGQIVGPHGSGKTTLLRTLAACWSDWGRDPVLVTLRDRQRRLPLTRRDAVRWTGRTQVIVDGYEQLRWRSRGWLAWRCRQAGCGLLVTTHAPLPRRPMIIETRATLGLARELVSELTVARGVASPSPSPDDVRRAFQQANGNLREMFFALYDSV